ncbi:MAG: nitroreductase family deazaflavin-dependent oxidoreductase [Roseiflexaceae bacterium]
MSDQKEYNRKLIEDFRANRGDGPFAGRPLLLLTTSGAKSNQPRTTPMMYVPDGERLLVIASNAGAAAHPDWYRNLLVQPNVTVEVGADTFDASAVVLAGTERQQLWDTIVASYPFFIEHQAKITREIPVIALERQSQ